MKSINKLVLMGHLTHDPETKTTPGGTVITTFSIAINKSWTTPDGDKKEEVDYYRITAFNKLAEIYNKYLKKGRKTYVEGHLTTHKFTTKDGQARTTTEIIADDINMLDSTKETEAKETEATEITAPADPNAEAEYMEKAKDIA